MILDYKFKRTCYPIEKHGELKIDSTEELCTGSAYDKLIEILSHKGVPAEIIHFLEYRLPNSKSWQKVGNEPLALRSYRRAKIFLKVTLKPCTEQLHEDLVARINVLEHEKLTVKHQIQDLTQCVRQLQQQMEELKANQQGVPFDPNLTIPSMAKVNSVNTPSLVSQISATKKDLDIVYIYAMPLVKKSKRGLKEALLNPIDAHKEVTALEKLFLNSKKEIQFSINTGNTSNIRRVLEQHPKVLHISCHGGYELEDGKSKPYLYLEDNKSIGIMQKYSEETIREIFNLIKSDKELVRLRLIFLSACYSQKFGETIMKEGIPNVIAVNGYTQVADEAATGFAVSFYHFLLQGKSVREAFESAKVEEKINNKKIKLCCCTHNHKDYCPWLDKLCKDRDAAHAMHAPSCDCNYGGNLHHSRCRWLKRIPDEYFNKVPVENSGYVKMCCCSLEIPHNEEEKFILLSQTPEAADERIFDSLSSGECTVNKCYIESLVPKVDEMLSGRNIEVQQLVEMLTCRPPKKIICVTGPPGIGKSLLIRTAAKYVMERMGTTQYEHQNFPDGFVTIKLINTLWLLTKLNSVLLPAQETSSLEELAKEIAKQRKLVVLECENVMKNNAALLVKGLKEIVKDSEIRFILTSNANIPELTIDGEVTLKENLDTLSAYNIIKGIYPEWKMLYIEFCETKLAAKIKTPWLLKRVARLLKDSSEEEVYCRLCDEKVISKDEGSKDEDANYENLIENILNAIRMKCGTLLPIYLLAQMHSGLFESTFTELVNNDQLKESFDEYIVENESIAIVTKVKVEELNEYRYRISDDIINYIDANLTMEQKSPYIVMCLQKLARVARLLVRSYNFLLYKKVSYDEFTAILDEGLWLCSEKLTENTPLLKDPITRFEYEKDNIIVLLDREKLQKVANITTPESMQSLLSYIKELTLCTFALLSYFGKPNEAMNIVDAIQGFARFRDYRINYEHSPIKEKYMELEATMMLLKQSLSLSHMKRSERGEGTKETEAAEEIFSTINNNAGIGEAQYLRGLLLAQCKYEFIKASGLYEAALVSFKKADCKLGEARVSIAMATLLLENKVKDKVLKLLRGAMKILKEHKYFDNMLGSCYYNRARYYEETKNYELAKQDLESALEAIDQWNKCDVNKCNVMLQRMSELIQQDCPLFAFLKAFPLVKVNGNECIPLEPNVRPTSYFRELLNNSFNQAHKSVKVHFDTLTLENLKHVLSKSCAVLHLSSDHYAKGYISMESKLGELIQVPLKKLHEELEHIISTSQCKVVVIAVPQGIDIAKMFLSLRIPHVIYFDFSEGDFYEHENKVDIRATIYDSMYKFCIDFYKNLLDKNSVANAWENAKYSAEEMLKRKGDELNIKYFHYGLEPGPVLLPAGDPKLHSMSIFSNLRDGEYINTSPKRAQCDIEKDRRPFIGRQTELYKIAKELIEGNYVNLYGDYGVGKTRLAKEISYFLYVRLLFKSDIWYIESLSKGKSFKFILESRLRCSQYDENNMSILIVIDNMTPDLWQCERHYFNSLKNARNFVFLFVSHDPLEPREGADFPMFQWELKPFKDKEISLDFIFAMLEQVKSYPKAASLGVEEYNRKALRTAMAGTRGFNQANGYPKLLLIFYEKIVESDNIPAIDMMNDHTINARYRKIMRNIDKASGNKGIAYNQTNVKNENPCIPEENNEFSKEKVLNEESKRDSKSSLSIASYPNNEGKNNLDQDIDDYEINTSLVKDCYSNQSFEDDYTENKIIYRLNGQFEEDIKEKLIEEKPEGKVSNQGSLRCESDESEDSSSESMGNISNVNHEKQDTTYYDRDEEGEAILDMLNSRPKKVTHSRKKKVQKNVKKEQQNERKMERRKVKNEGEKNEKVKPMQKKQAGKTSKTGKNAKRYKKSTKNKYYKYKEAHKEPEEKEDELNDRDKDKDFNALNIEYAFQSDVSNESECESPK